MNVSREMWLACSRKDGVCMKTYEQMHTTLDTNAFWDLIEMQAVSASWEDAAIANAKEQQNG